MDKELNRLENKIATQAQSIRKLEARNQELTEEVNTANALVRQLQTRLGEDHPEEYIGNVDTIQTLEAKLATTTWELLEVQQALINCQDQLRNMESELLVSERNFFLTRHQLQQAEQLLKLGEHKSPHQQEAIREWQRSLEEKEKLAAENSRLRNQITDIQTKYGREIGKILEQTGRLLRKVEQSQENHKKNNENTLNLVEELEKQNESLREQLKQRNEHLATLMRQGEGITTQKGSDMHTIKNLRRQFRKKGELLNTLVHKLAENQQVKEKYEEFNQFFQRNYEEYGNIPKQHEKIKRDNEVLKIKLAEEKERNESLKKILAQEAQKVVQILVQNEACHRLLFEVRGRSNLYKTDIEEKVKQFLCDLERRRNMLGTWTDVGQLVQVNQRLRIHRCGIAFSQQDD